MKPQSIVLSARGKSFNRLIIDHDIAVEFVDTVGDVILRLEGLFEVAADGWRHSFDPTQLTNVDQLRSLLGRPLHSFAAKEEEPMVVLFEDGAMLKAFVDPQYEWFNLYFGKLQQVHGTPGGGLMIFS